MARDRAARPEARPLRLFVAVDVPEDVKQSLADAVAPFRRRIPGARWTNLEGWHVTLKFLGSTWPRLVDEVCGAVDRAAAESRRFETSLGEVGAFPSPGRARVLWAGLADQDRKFAAMVKLLDDLFAAHFTAEKREFTPHLTVARLNPPASFSEHAPELIGLRVASRTFPVDRLVLYRSHLSPRGARYEPIHSAPIG